MAISCEAYPNAVQVAHYDGPQYTNTTNYRLGCDGAHPVYCCTGCIGSSCYDCCAVSSAACSGCPFCGAGLCPPCH